MRRLLLLAAVLGFAVQAPAQTISRAGQPLRLVLAGAPLTGKGTNSERIVRDYRTVPIPVGVLLREEAKKDPVLKKTMDSGELVPAERVINLVGARLAEPDVQENGYMLDGFPRREEETLAFMRMQAARHIDAVLILSAPLDVLRERARTRGRSDDTPETVERRMEIFEKETRPALAKLRAIAPVIEIDSSGAPDEVYSRIKVALDRLFAVRK